MQNLPLKKQQSLKNCCWSEKVSHCDVFLPEAVTVAAFSTFEEFMLNFVKSSPAAKEMTLHQIPAWH